MSCCGSDVEAQYSVPKGPGVNPQPSQEEVKNLALFFALEPRRSIAKYRQCYLHMRMAIKKLQLRCSHYNIIQSLTRKN